MKKIIFFFLFVFAGYAFADLTIDAPTQPNAQASIDSSAQQINQFFDKANYKLLKRYEFKPLFKVPSHD
jgi:hypothetical protein